MPSFFISHIFWKLQFRFLDEPIKGIGVSNYSLSKGQSTTNKLIEQDSKRPVVGLKGVAFSLEDLRSHVMRGANDGECFEHVTRIKFFGSSKIDEVGLALMVNH